MTCPHNPTKNFSNGDLPDGVDLRLWRRAFVSTYMQFVGSLTNPWKVPIRLACEKMQLIWNAVFPNVQHTVTTPSTVYRIVRRFHMYIARLTNICGHSACCRLLAKFNWLGSYCHSHRIPWISRRPPAFQQQSSGVCSTHLTNFDSCTRRLMVMTKR